MNWEEQAERSRQIIYNQYRREQAARTAYETERSSAVNTLASIIILLESKLLQCDEHGVNADTAAIITAYASAETLYLQLLRESCKKPAGKP